MNVSKNYQRLLQAGGPYWAMDPHWLNAILAGDELPAPPPKQEPRIVAGCCIIPIVGPMSPAGFNPGEGYGASTIELTQHVLAAVRSSAVQTILLNFDSPGGSVEGTMSLAEAVRTATKYKKVVAYANWNMQSAAFWVGCQATELIAAPQSSLGGIGVWCLHQNLSGALEQAGIEVTLVQAGANKTLGHPFGPLSETAKDYLQEGVNDHCADFLAAVARGRNVTTGFVEEHFGQGKSYRDRKAVARGLADRVESVDQLMSRLVQPSKARRTVAAMGADTKATQAWLAAANGPAIGPLDRDPVVLRQRLDALERKFASRGDAKAWRASL